MSQIKIIVRQPPNRDFLEGFPGIPPNAPERPHAALRGTVELRVQGGTPVKAKWVQIELKKIETLLQGQGEPYVETIGHAPKIWTANGEFENLQVRDFPFYIQIPMNVPPSIALEKGSGIRYEMVASLCMKGKKGLLRMKDKNNVTSTSVPIVMDKHELHTLWPVYHRPQTSTSTNDGLNLTVTRDASCYGPGDSVTAHVELRSGRTSPCILRAWEMTLREHVIFRPDPSQVNPKQGPQAAAQQYRHNVITEQKKSLSKTIYESVTVADELACLIPIQHRTATTQGRLIEVQFTLSVKAVMESAGSVEVMMPVLMSHWSREMSENALRKIGPVPHLGINVPSAQVVKPAPQGYSQSQSNGSLQQLPMGSPDKAPPKPIPGPEEVGPPSPPYTPPEMGSNFSSQQSVPGRQNGRPRESTISGRPRQLAVVNIDPHEDGSTSTAPAAPAAQPSQPYKASWETAEEEKRRLKESFVQGNGQSSSSTAPLASAITSTPSTLAAKLNFSSAEEEKERLYRKAQAQARKTQELARKEQGLPPRSAAPVTSVSRETSGGSGSTSESSAAMRPGTANTVTSVASSATPMTPPMTATKAPSIRSEGGPQTPNWASAEAEKERLYRQAQRRARETQARVAQAGGSMSGRSRSGSNTSLTNLANQRQSMTPVQAISARPTSTFKLNNPDPPEMATAQSVSPAPASVREASVSPPPAPVAGLGAPSAASAAQAMYAQAMAARQSTASPPRQSMYSPALAQPTYGHTSRPSQASVSSQPPSYGGSGSSGAAPAPAWNSAENEKAQLNRYYEAKRAVAQKEQGGSMDSPMAGGSSSGFVPGQSASPPPSSTNTASPQPTPQRVLSPSNAAPYPAAAPVRMNSAMSQRQEQTPSPVYARSLPQQAPTPPVGYASPPPADYFNGQPSHGSSQASSPSPPAFSPSRASALPNPLDEKERMKLFFEAQDATRRYQETQGASGSGSSSMNSALPPAPMASSSSYPSPPATAGPPGYDDAPPAFDGGSSQPMSALEEKARLARQYQQQQQQAQGPLSRSSSVQSVRSPGPSHAVPYGMSPMQSPSYGNGALPPITTQYTPSPMQRATSYKFIPSPIEEEPPAGPPPPLMPRPPQEYIEQSIAEEGASTEEGGVAHPQQQPQPPNRQQSWDPQPLNFRPVSPLSIPLLHAQSPAPQNPQWQQGLPAQPQYAQQYAQPQQAPYYR